MKLASSVVIGLPSPHPEASNLCRKTCHAGFYGLRSLFDVVQFALDQYMRTWEGGADLWTATYDMDDKVEGAEAVKVVIVELLRIREMCAHLGIDSTDQVNRVMHRIKQGTSGEVGMTLVRELEHAIQKELKGRLCFLMTREESTFYGTVGASRTVVKFTESATHIQEASKCLSLGLPEASVYHSMCALESPLAAMARYFQVSFATATWGRIIHTISDRLEKIRRTARAGKHKTDVLHFYGEAAKEFAYFNEAWRVHVMHGKSSYDSHNARSVYDHVVHFTDHLAKRLSDHSRAKCKL